MAQAHDINGRRAPVEKLSDSRELRR